MSILIQNVSMQQLKHEFESFLKRFYRKLLVLQPEIYIVSNITKDAVHLQIIWKSISAGGYVTYNASTTYKSDYLAAISQMRRMGDYSLRCRIIGRLPLCRCILWYATHTTGN